MALIRLGSRAQQRLKHIARWSSNARQVRRAQALLWLQRGESVETVASRLGVSRRTIYNWVEQYQDRRAEPLAERLTDRPHPGRPPAKLKLVVKVIRSLLKRDPRRCGSRSPVWTVPLLRHQVEHRTGESASARTVRRALRALRYRYKRPRYVLARRSPTWRQAKGGLNAA